MNATIWHNPKCGTSRKTLAILQDTAGIDLTVVEYLKEPASREKLAQLFSDAGIEAKDALRVRGSSAEELGLTSDNVTNDHILDEMAKDSALVNRPLVETEKGARLCRPQDTVYEIL